MYTYTRYTYTEHIDITLTHTQALGQSITLVILYIQTVMDYVDQEKFQ